MSISSPFVDTHWLNEHLSSPDVCIVDGSWHLPNAGRDANAEFLQAHIPGAVYFDLDVIANSDTDLPHMVAGPDDFAKMVGQLGIRETNTIIVYDSAGLFSAARVWWNFKIMGAENCYVLEGGLAKWMLEERPLQSGKSLESQRPFMAKFDEEMVVDQNELLNFITSKESISNLQIIDLRPSMRFAGLEEEPRPGLRSGYIPGSINVPFADLVVDGQLIETHQLSARLRTAGIDLTKPIVATCGSGVTAPILSLALAEIGIKAMRVYDGSWAQWGMQNGLPVLGADGSPV